MSEINLKSLVALTVIGSMFYLVLSYSEQILLSISEIVALYVLGESKFFSIYLIIPKLIILVFWIIIVFRFLDNFTGKISISEDLPRKYALRILYLAIALLLIQWGVYFLSQHILIIKKPPYYYDSKTMNIIGFINAFLSVTEVIIIFIGYYKVIKSTTAVNNEGNE